MPPGGSNPLMARAGIQVRPLTDADRPAAVLEIVSLDATAPRGEAALARSD
jgi:hypothetical protein